MPAPTVLSTDPISPLESIFNNAGANLNGERAIRSYRASDLDALVLLTAATVGDEATVTEGGARFSRTATPAWVQITPATFATTAARDSAYLKGSGAFKVLFADAIDLSTGIRSRWTTAWKPWESDWIAFTPTLGSASGAMTSASASMRYKWVSGVFTFWFLANIASAGTGAGNLSATWPVTSARDWSTAGVVTNIGTLAGIRLAGTSTAQMFSASGGTVIATGNSIAFTGSMEV